MEKKKKLMIVLPCYNEQEVLPVTAPMFLRKIEELIDAGKIADDSRILFVNDGSKDNTWNIICELAEKNSHYMGNRRQRCGKHRSGMVRFRANNRKKTDRRCISGTCPFFQQIDGVRNPGMAAGKLTEMVIP